jgi:hypothetical protein
VQTGLDRVQQMLAALPPSLFAAVPKHEPSRRELTPQDRTRLAAIHERAARRFHVANLPVPPPRRQTSFGALAEALNSRMEA